MKRNRAGIILRKLKGKSLKRQKEILNSELEEQFNNGYSDGHEFQMKMRILDKQENFQNPYTQNYPNPFN